MERVVSAGADIPDISALADRAVEPAGKRYPSRLSTSFSVNLPRQMHEEVPFNPRDKLWVKVCEDKIVIWRRDPKSQR